MASFYIQHPAAASVPNSDMCAQVWYDGDNVSRVELVHRVKASSYSKRSEARRAIEQFPAAMAGIAWVIQVR